MPFSLEITSVTQVAPISATVATVLIQFVVTGIRPDLVQVYAYHAAASGAGGLGDVVDTVDLNMTDPAYSSSFQVQAGTYYTIALCPRTKTGDDLDDEIEGQYWESYCVSTSIVTQSSDQPQGKLPAPIINSLSAKPATASQGGQITVSWSSSMTYNKFLIWWTENGQALQQGELDVQGASGSWTAGPTTPGATYTFSVKGGLYGGFQYNYSDWGSNVKAVAPQNLNALKQFLQLSGITLNGQGVRSVMATQSVRAFMKLA